MHGNLASNSYLHGVWHASGSLHKETEVRKRSRWEWSQILSVMPGRVESMNESPQLGHWLPGERQEAGL